MTIHTTTILQVLYQDDYFVAVNKPAGMLVHRSHIDHYETQFVLQTLRDQLGKKLYLVHRLDKPTSGVLLFAFDSEAVEKTQAIWQNVEKTYLAVVRGFFPEYINLDKPLKPIDPFANTKTGNTEASKLQDACTKFYNLAHCELDYAVDKYPTSRYSLIKAIPQHGRKHQIRRHLKHLSHPIIGDTAYGKSIHNRFFQQQFGIQQLLLHCQQIDFIHPYTNQEITIKAEVDVNWLKLPAQLLNLAINFQA